MNTYEVSAPEVALVAITRGLGGAGAGLLLADRLRPESRRVVGIALLAVGVLSTIPLLLEIFSKPIKMHGRDFERNLSDSENLDSTN